jgi:hypothetical protein
MLPLKSTTKILASALTMEPSLSADNFAAFLSALAFSFAAFLSFLSFSFNSSLDKR